MPAKAHVSTSEVTRRVERLTVLQPDLAAPHEATEGSSQSCCPHRALTRACVK